MTRQLILGSTSQPRRELLQRLQIPFEICAPDLDETPLENETPKELVLRLAEAKARKVAESFSDALIIGADQVGVIDNTIQGKPLTYDKAVQQLTAASGKRMQFFIGLCVLDARKNISQIALEEFDVIYRDLTLPMIENYLKKETPFQCAGSCKAEGLGIALINEFSGKDFTALIGLPLIRLVNLLENAGLSPLA